MNYKLKRRLESMAQSTSGSPNHEISKFILFVGSLCLPCRIQTESGSGAFKPIESGSGPLNRTRNFVCLTLRYIIPYCTYITYFFLLGLASGVLPSPLLTHQYAEYNN
jgi:hypothetical protein